MVKKIGLLRHLRFRKGRSEEQVGQQSQETEIS